MNTQLRRSASDKMVAGVAGGIAETFGWDPTWVRLGFVVLTLINGGGLLLYLLLLLVMPKAGEVSIAQQAVAGVSNGVGALRSGERNRWLGYVLLGIGAIMLINILNLPGPLMALAIIAGGWYLLRQR